MRVMVVRLVELRVHVLQGRRAGRGVVVAGADETDGAARGKRGGLWNASRLVSRCFAGRFASFGDRSTFVTTRLTMAVARRG